MSKLEDTYEIVKNSERWDTMRTSVLCSLVGSLYAHLDNEESSSDFEMIDSMVSLSQQLSQIVPSPYNDVKFFTGEEDAKNSGDHSKSLMMRATYLAFITRNQDLKTAREIVFDDCHASSEDDANCLYICVSIIKAAMNGISPSDIVKKLDHYVHAQGLTHAPAKTHSNITALEALQYSANFFMHQKVKNTFEVDEKDGSPASTVKMMILLLAIMDAQFQGGEFLKQNMKTSTCDKCSDNEKGCGEVFQYDPLGHAKGTSGHTKSVICGTVFFIVPISVSLKDGKKRIIFHQVVRKTSDKCPDSFFDSMLQFIMSFQNILGDGCAALCGLIGAYVTSLTKLEESHVKSPSLLEINCDSRLYRMMKKRNSSLCRVFTAFDELYDITAHFILGIKEPRCKNHIIEQLDCEDFIITTQWIQMFQKALQNKDIIAQRFMSLVRTTHKVMGNADLQDILKIYLYPQALKYLCLYSSRSLFQRAPVIDVRHTDNIAIFQEEAKFLYEFITNQVHGTARWKALVMEIFSRKTHPSEDLINVLKVNFPEVEKVVSKADDRQLISDDARLTILAYETYCSELKISDASEPLKSFQFMIRVILEANNYVYHDNDIYMLNPFLMIVVPDEEEARLFGRFLSSRVLLQAIKLTDAPQVKAAESAQQEEFIFDQSRWSRSFSLLGTTPQISTIKILIPPLTTRIMSVFESPAIMSARVQVYGKRAAKYYFTKTQELSADNIMLEALLRGALAENLPDTKTKSPRDDNLKQMQEAVSITFDIREAVKSTVSSKLSKNTTISQTLVLAYCMYVMDDCSKCHGTIPILNEDEWNVMFLKASSARTFTATRVLKVLKSLDSRCSGNSPLTDDSKKTTKIHPNHEKIIMDVARKFSKNARSREEIVKELCEGDQSKLCEDKQSKLMAIAAEMLLLCTRRSTSTNTLNAKKIILIVAAIVAIFVLVKVLINVFSV